MKQRHHDDGTIGLVENVEWIDDRSFDGERFGKEPGSFNQSGDRCVGANPATIAADTNGKEVIPLRIGGGENVTGCHPRDIVFGGLATEKHNETQSFGTGHEPTVVGGARSIDHTPVCLGSETPRL
jgi:hypothetical protein